jgi:hypothetical protein
MAVRNLSHLISLIALRGEIIHTLDQVKAHPLTQTYVPLFEALRDEWNAVFTEELALRDGLSAANARVFAVDTALNALASRVAKVLLILTGDDKAHPLYFAYFKKKSLTDFKRPILGAQLEAMKGWIPELKKSDDATLAALGAEVETAVALAEQALATRTKLETESSFFRETGNRKKLFDKVNAARKQTHGELAKMPHEKLGVPASFANLFFRHVSGGDAEEAITLEALDEEIASLENQLAERKAVRDALRVAIEKQAQMAAEKASEQAALLELEKAAAAAAQKVAEAKAKLAAMQA